MNRRNLLVAALVGPAVIRPEIASAGEVNGPALDAQVGRWRERMRLVGAGQVARHRRAHAPEVQVEHAALFSTMEHGFGAYAPVVWLRGRSPAELAHPSVQALFDDVAVAVGESMLLVEHLLDGLDAIHGESWHGALAERFEQFTDHDGDDHLDRASMVALRGHRRRMRDLVREHGPGALIADVRSSLANARSNVSTDVLPAEVPNYGMSLWKSPGREVAHGFGVAFIAIGSVGLAVGVLLVLAGGCFGVPIGILLGLLSGVFLALGVYLANGRTPRLPWELREFNVAPDGSFVKTGVPSGRPNLEVTCGGSVRVFGSMVDCGPEGLFGTTAGTGAPIPEAALGALVVRAGVYRGLLSQPSKWSRWSSPIFLAVNVAPGGVPGTGAFTVSFAVGE